MKFKKLLENWDMTGLKIKTAVADLEWKPQEKDREAAWDLYVELLTRVATQPLPGLEGDEQAALESIHALFAITRQILREKGRDCVEFTKIAVLVLNQRVRPFTSKWHRQLAGPAFSDPQLRSTFRADLQELQLDLGNYMRLLADLAQVEDLSDLPRRNPGASVAR